MIATKARLRIGELSDGYVNADYYSPEINLGGSDQMGLHIIIDNTDLVGTMYFQVSNNGGNNWVSVPYSTQDPSDTTQSILLDGVTLASATDVNMFVVASDFPADKARVFIDWTSGAGLLSVYPRVPKGV